MQHTTEDDLLMRSIAARQPMLRLGEEKKSEPVAAERRKPQRGGYIYTPILAHPLEFGMEKLENDNAVRRFRLLPMEKRIEAAVAMNLPWVVEELYLGGAPPSCPNKSGYTPLHIAAARNYPGCVEVLLNMKMDVLINAVTSKGYTPLYLARSCGSTLCAKLIRDSGGVEGGIPPLKGYRSILDIPVHVPSAMPFANRAADDKARNLGAPSYFGQY